MSLGRRNVTSARGDDDRVDVFARLVLWMRLVLVMLGWATAVSVSALLTPSPSVQAGATVVHVLSLVVAFGAVVVVDWHGLLWVRGRHNLHESIRLAATSGPLIWAGLIGLLVSGALLNPDLSKGLTWLKLILVLVVGINGMVTTTTAELLRDLPSSVTPAGLPRHLQARVFATSMISQVGWWGAIIIGFMTASHGA